MKTKWILLASAALVSWFIIASFATPNVPITTREFMREKLVHSQKALEAVVVEDFYTLGQESRKLSAMTEQATWQVFQNPDYTQHSATFRRHANALTKAAHDKNLDAATLAYVRLTMSCVDCHKFVRGKLIAVNETRWQTALARE